MAFSQILKHSPRTLEVFHSSIHSSSSSPLISVKITSEETIKPSQASIPSSLHLHPLSFCNKTIDNPLTTEAESLCKKISTHRDSSKLESLLNSSQIHLSPPLVVEVLQKLSNAGVFALSFFRWAEKQKVFKHTSESYNALMEGDQVFDKMSKRKFKPFQTSVRTAIFPSSLHLHPRTFCNKTSDNTVTTEAESLCKMISNHCDSSKLESLLNSTQIQLSPPLVVEVLKKLSNAGVFALSFFRWAEKQKGFKHTSESYDALIEALGKIKQFKLIWKLVNEMKVKGVLGKGTFALISRRYARAKKVKEAVEAFERMEKFGLKPELSDYNRFLDNLCKSRQVESAHQVFDKMSKRKFKPDIKSYTILLEGWGQELNLLMLDEVYREMKGNGFEPDVVAYGIIVNAYCKAKKFDLAIETFDEMRLKNIEPTPHIYCSLINGLGSVKRLTESLTFFEISKSCGHPPEAPTYNAVVGSYCWSMRMDDAFQVMEEMRRCGVGPNSRTFDIILHHLVKLRRTEEAFRVFRRMRDEFGCEPSVSSYEIMVRMFCNEGRVDMAMSVWEEMKGRGVLPGMHMFSTLINGLCREKKVVDGCRYFEEMLDMGIRPPVKMFDNLKRSLVSEGKEDVVLKLTHRLEKLRTLLVVS